MNHDDNPEKVGQIIRVSNIDLKDEIIILKIETKG